MSKRIRRGDPIYIAPEIIGWEDEEGEYKVIDKRTNESLDPKDPHHKIKIYKRQVYDWFLTPATNLVKYKPKNKGFIVLMICLSHLEGVEQLRRGRSSRGRSEEFFIQAMGRLYPSEFRNDQLANFYKEARCGLFHDGMTRGMIIVNNDFPKSIDFVNSDIHVSPSKFLKDIKKDFENYLQELLINEDSRTHFDNIFSNI